MSGGGIIIQRNEVMLVAVTDPCMYDSLSAHTKALVDAIDAKDPMSRTKADLQVLLRALQEACGC
jgi:hypothetical protein